MKKSAVFILLVCMLQIAIFSGCNKAANESASSSTKISSSQAGNTTEKSGTGYEMSDVGNMTAPGVLPIAVDEVTLKLGICQNQAVTDYVDNSFTRYIKEKTNINVEFFFFPEDRTEAIQKLELLVSSNSELPDVIFQLPLKNSARYNFGKQGFFLPLNNYLDKYSYYLNKMMEGEDPSIAKNIKHLGISPDGNQYGFVWYQNNPLDNCPDQMHINVKWLKALGLEKPTTTDELYKVLKAFRDKDPNGNGKADEIPLTGSLSWSMDVDLNLINSFTYWSPNALGIDNGKIYPIFTTNDYKKGLAFCSKLCSEGLLSPLSFTNDGDQNGALMNPAENEPELVGVFCGYQLLTFNAGTKDNKYDYEYLPLLKGPEGKAYGSYSPPMVNYAYYITKYCKNPEIAFRLLDFFCNDECMMSARYGVRGEHWDYIEKGSMPSIFEPLGFKADRVCYTNIWGKQTNAHWLCSIQDTPIMSFGAAIMAKKADEKTQADLDEEWMNTSYQESYFDRYGKWPDERVDAVVYTEAEELEIDEIKTVITNYIEEQRVSFITGVKNLETDWDTYLAELESIGLSKYIAVTQTAYDRTYKK